MRKDSSSLWSPNEEVRKKSKLEIFCKHLDRKKLLKETIRKILKFKCRYSYKQYYKKNVKANNERVFNARAFFAHEVFCNYISNDKFIIVYDESGLN